MWFWSTLFSYFVLDAIAAFTTARWLKGGGRGYLVVSFLLYTGCTICWLIGVAQSDGPGFAKASVIYPIWAMICGLLVGIFVAQEKLVARDYVGVVLGFIALILIATKTKTGDP